MSHARSRLSAAAVLALLLLAGVGTGAWGQAAPSRGLHPLHHPLVTVRPHGSSGEVAARGHGPGSGPAVIEALSSTNWSGYVLSGSGGSFRAVAGCWIVPPVSPGPSAAYSSTWIGIDGTSSGDLIQVGTDQDWSSPSGNAPFSAEYSAWWEMLTPSQQNPETAIPMTITPGDTVCADISESAPGEWDVRLDDMSSGAAPFSTAQVYAGPGASAEWVLERPEICIGSTCEFSSLADYAQTTFDLATVNGHAPGFAADEAVEMYDDSGAQLISTPSDPDGDTDGFGIAYGASPPPPPPTVSPSAGLASGGQAVTLTGSGFQPGATVSFGATPAPQVSVASGSQLTAVTPPGAGTVTVTVTDPNGVWAADLLAYTYAVGGAYTPLQPFRICDTRQGAGTECSGNYGDQRISAGQTLTFAVSGVPGPQGQTVPSGASAAVLNVTAISGSSATYLTLHATGSALPLTSNLNVTAGLNRANLAVVPLGTGGQVSLYNAAGTINVAVDVEGFFTPASGSPAAGTFHPMAPLRICDTRSGTNTECSGSALQGGEWTRVVVTGLPSGAPTGTASVPADGTAEAAALNLTAVSGSAATYLSVAPPGGDDRCPSGAPSFSNLNVAALTDLANRAVVPLGPAGDICVYNAAGSIDLVVDVSGWFGDGGEVSMGALFYAIPPERICDTRPTTGTECSGEQLGAGQTLTVPVAGVDAIPAAGGATPPVAVVANLTAVSGSADTYLTLYPADGAALPTASDVNPPPGKVVPNLAIAELAPSGLNAGAVDLYNASGRINAIIDVQGWFQ